MNLYISKIAILTFIIHLSSAWSCPMTNYDSQMSWVNSIEETSKSSNITEEEFNLLIKRVSGSYHETFKRKGLKLKIEGRWKSKENNAYSDQSGSNRFVYLYGGYARLPLMDQDTFLSVICHEIGHHLGGFPRAEGSTWASSEGQADYFSTLKCMKVVLKDDSENEKMALSLDLPVEVKDQCRTQFQKDDDYHICLRSSKAAETYGKINASLATPDSTKEISLLTPTFKRVFFTNLWYPLPQCRVDTKFQGALCNSEIEVPLGYDDENKGVCSLKNGTPIGERPSCWFAPRR